MIVLAQLEADAFGMLRVPGAIGGIIQIGNFALARVDTLPAGAVLLADDIGLRLTTTRRSALRTALGLETGEVPDVPVEELIYLLLTASARGDRWGRLLAEHDGNERIYLGGQRIVGSAPGPASALVMSDDFTGSNGAAWNAAKWSSTPVLGAGTVTIQTNKGRITNSTGTITGGRGLYSTNVANAEILVSAVFSVATAGIQHYAILRGDGTFAAVGARLQNAGYCLYRRSGDGGVADAENYLAIVKGNTSFGTELVRVEGLYAYTTTFWYRFQVSGSTLRAKRWQDGSGEPGTWTLETTDTAVATGHAGLNHVYTGTDTAAHTDWDGFELWDLDQNVPQFEQSALWIPAVVRKRPIITVVG